MARRKIRTTSTFSLSFLDIMSCGLGAAVLIFLLLKHVVDTPTPNLTPTQTAEINLLEEEIKIGELNLARIRNTISDVSDETVTAQGLARQILEELEKLRAIVADTDDPLNADIPTLKAKIARLQAQKSKLESTVPQGNKAFRFTGDGRRQYLSGVKLGGERVAILVDSSASMLDDSIVNIIRRRALSDDAKRQAPKWNRTLAITQWIVANLPLNSDFQILSFNDEVAPAFGEDYNAWYEVSDRLSVASNIQGINQVVPKNGTNMQEVFRAAMSMTPKPDNIFLITDGLPTLGKGAPRGAARISGNQRVRVFNEARKELLPDIPVNILLLPLEGDPDAAGLFWKMAARSRGSFLTPARDWP